MPVPAYADNVSHYREMAEAYEDMAAKREAIAKIPYSLYETREYTLQKHACAKTARRLRRLARQMRKFEAIVRLANFLLCVKLWVLASPERRATLRKRIGERAIKRWYDRLAARLAQFSSVIPDLEPAKPLQEQSIFAEQRPKHKHKYKPKDGQTNIRPWYRLAPLPPAAGNPDADSGAVKTTQIADRLRSSGKSGLRRAFPAVYFMPWELDPDSCGLPPAPDLCFLSERPHDKDVIINQPLDHERLALRHARIQKMPRQDSTSKLNKMADEMPKTHVPP